MSTGQDIETAIRGLKGATDEVKAFAERYTGEKKALVDQVNVLTSQLTTIEQKMAMGVRGGFGRPVPGYPDTSWGSSFVASQAYQGREKGRS